MKIVGGILALFAFGTILGLIIHFRWGKVCSVYQPQEDLLMSRKPAKQPKKQKPNLNKPPVKAIIHLDYLRVYNEVLKHEEVMDIELDHIFNTTVAVMKQNLAELKMSNEPKDDSINILVNEILDRLELTKDIPF